MNRTEGSGDESSSLAAILVIAVLALIAIMLIVYFAWWQPVGRDTVIIEREREREQPAVPPPGPIVPETPREPAPNGPGDQVPPD